MPKDKSAVYHQLEEIKKYSDENQMKINLKKTKFMLFNPTTSYDFIPEHKAEGIEVETVDEMKILGLTIRNDLKWTSNTSNMVEKASKKLWMIKRLKMHGANLDDLKDVYIKQVRSILEFGVPVWNCSLTKAEITDIERVQKTFLHIVLGQEYDNYHNSLEEMQLDSLEDRRVKICERFAKKTLKHPKHKSWFVKNQNVPTTRSAKPNLRPPLYRLKRFRNSPIPYLTNLLNSQ